MGGAARDTPTVRHQSQPSPLRAPLSRGLHLSASRSGSVRSTGPSVLPACALLALRDGLGSLSLITVRSHLACQPQPSRAWRPPLTSALLQLSSTASATWRHRCPTEHRRGLGRRSTGSEPRGILALWTGQPLWAVCSSGKGVSLPPVHECWEQRQYLRYSGTQDQRKRE